MRDLVRYLLKNRMSLPHENWTMQGFGFLRLKIDDGVRIHVWDSRLRQPGVSDIHDHTQWAFTSHILSGSLVNIRYTLHEKEGQPHHMATLTCGIGGGMHGQPQAVNLMPGSPELYLPGSSYRQEPDEIHRTMPADGTVTLIRQERSDVATARVFWPVGGTWGDAIPRVATRDEVDEVGGFALSIFASTSTARTIEGTWPAADPRRAFVEGAKWQLWDTEGATMFASERERAEAEAEKRYPSPEERKHEAERSPLPQPHEPSKEKS